MRALAHAYDRAIVALAIIAGAMVAAVFLMIVYDVSMRTVGLRPPNFTSALTEYALLYMTMLATPWLVRVKGHVMVESLVATFPEMLRRLVERLVYALCLLVCLGIAYYGLVAAGDAFTRGEVDLRSITLPRGFQFVILPLGFGLTAVEFLRLLAGRDSLYSRTGRAVDGL